jgi:hypothetical protein
MNTGQPKAMSLNIEMVIQDMFQSTSQARTKVVEHTGACVAQG